MTQPSSSYNENSLKAELHQKGGRLTPQREKILKFFQDFRTYALTGLPCSGSVGK